VPNTVSAVLAGKPLSTGGVLIAPLGTALPVDATGVPDPAFVAAGYIGEDGVTESAERSTEKIRAWGLDVVKVVSTEFSVTYEFVFLETLNTTVLQTVYGDDNVLQTDASPTAGALRVVAINGDDLPHKSFVIEVKDGPARVRIVIPDGQVTEVGEVTYTDAEVIGYEVTVEAFQDADGNNAYKYISDGVPVPAPLP
jgi:hypothetical protein